MADERGTGGRDRVPTLGGSRHPFIPAAGVSWLAPLCDVGVALLTRERSWRQALLEQVAPAGGDLVAEVGCDTGSWVVPSARAAPAAVFVGIDPDPEVLARARRKARAGDLRIDWLEGFADQTDTLLHGRRATKVVCALLFHHLAPDEQRHALSAFRSALAREGELHIADYGLQRSRRMRFLFRQTIQRLDGVATTAANARGEVPERCLEAGFVDVVETRSFDTPTGSISLSRAQRGASVSALATGSRRFCGDARHSRHRAGSANLGIRIENPRQGRASDFPPTRAAVRYGVATLPWSHPEAAIRLTSPRAVRVTNGAGNSGTARTTRPIKSYPSPLTRAQRPLYGDARVTAPIGSRRIAEHRSAERPLNG